jgi:hypothetical protein
MRPKDLLVRLVERPFRAFRVHLSDGMSIDVTQPGMVIVGLSSAILPTRFKRDPDGYRVADLWQTIALVHIVRFSDLNGRSNGKRSRRSS